MDNRIFDHLTRSLARPTSRRGALWSGVGAVAIGAGMARRPAIAQETTPAPEAADSAPPVFMFVQIAEAGTWRPKPGEPGVYLLTLDDVEEETVFFSDRSQRIVGTVPTQTLLDGIGFTPANPPNAALVVQTESGQDVLVVQLLNPSYEPLTEQLTYEALVLPLGEASEGLSHLAARQADMELPESFGAVSLFIDDCPDQEIICRRSCGETSVGSLGIRGTCWSWERLWCDPCTGWNAVTEECNQKFPVECQTMGYESVQHICWANSTEWLTCPGFFGERQDGGLL